MSFNSVFKSIILVCVVAFYCDLSQAQKAGITFGLSQIQMEGRSGVDIDSNGSYQAGALFYQPMTDLISVRMGAVFVKELLTISSAGIDTDLDLLNVNVPLTLGLNINERALIFAGPVLSLNASKSCKSTPSCNVSSLKVKGTDVLLSLGGHFQLTDVIGLEVTYDRMSGKPFEGASSGQVFNVNFQYLIE